MGGVREAACRVPIARDRRRARRGRRLDCGSAANPQKRIARRPFRDFAVAQTTSLMSRALDRRVTAVTLQGSPNFQAARALGWGSCGLAGRYPPSPMEKFVIQGGAPLSGEVTVAGNKNAALPILAACLLTEEEVLLHRVPRIRDTEAQLALLEQPRGRGRRGRRQQRPRSAPRGSPRRWSTRSSPVRSAPRSCSPGRCWPASAPPRCRRPAATSSAAAASTPTSTPSRTSAPASTARAGSS